MRIIYSLLLISLLNIAYATPQVGEDFLVDGEKFEIATYPLETHPEYREILKNSTLIYAQQTGEVIKERGLSKKIIFGLNG